MTAQTSDLNVITKSCIKAASSSLTKFVLILQDGRGVELEAGGAAPTIAAKVVGADELQEQTEAVCKVDWSWIIDSEVTNVSVSAGKVVFHLAPAGDLTIGAQMWQGSGFLSFMPWKPAK
jgi:hypothetical protein